MKRGLASPRVHSALPMTRRRRDQLLSVDQRKSRKRRAGLPVRSASSSAQARSTASSSTRRALRARPKTKSTRCASHQAIMRLAGEAAVGTQQDANPRPAGADLADEARDLLHCALGGVDVGAAQPRGQQVAAAEDVERQVAVGSRNSRGRSGLPGARTGGRRWHRGRGRSRGAAPRWASRKRSTNSASIAVVSWPMRW